MTMTTCPTSMNSVESLRDEFEFSSKDDALEAVLEQFPPTTLLRLHRDFVALAHAHQEPPCAAANGAPWRTWLLLGGRGAGKTRTGAEFVRALVHGHAPYADVRHGSFAAPRHGSIALVGETAHDVREVMIEGPSGILRTSPRSERPQWTGMRRRLEWPNGAVAYAFSAEDPEQLRGPQFDGAWCDELAKWHHVQAAFDMLQFGLRLGVRPRQLITTTPRPIPLIKRLVADARTAVTRAPTQANAAYLAPGFVDEVLARYGGTRLGGRRSTARSSRSAPTRCGRVR
jgi:phage terminase large subunit-like protein